MTTDDANGVEADNDCPLPVAQQTRNILCYAGFWCLHYLAAPVTYVGVTHANLLKELGNSDRTANLPHAVYQWLTAFPILIAWLFPQPRLLKRLLVLPLVAMGVMSGIVALTMWLDMSSDVISNAVIAHGAVFGLSGGLLLTSLWEVLRRGVSTSRRGKVLGLTFGVGPLLACVASLGQQALFSKTPIGGFSFGFSFPTNYMTLFALAAPLLLLEARVVASFIIPLPADKPPPDAGLLPTTRVAEIGQGLREFFTYQPLVFGAIAYLLVYSGGNAIMDNVSLHAKDVLQEASASTMGTQSFYRFGFKALGGVIFGWLLTKTHPKAMLLTTTGVLLIGMGWALNVTGSWYLLAFGWLGAGELFGAYFPNYIATASRKSQVRANIAYLNLLGALVGFASVLFGQISDHYGRIASFHTATAILVASFLLILMALPARPQPGDEPQSGCG